MSDEAQTTKVKFHVGPFTYIYQVPFYPFYVHVGYGCLIFHLFTPGDWEGPQALEEYSDSELIRPKSSKKQLLLDSRPKRPVDPVSESEEDPSSEDDYIADELQSKAAKVRFDIFLLATSLHFV